MEQHRGFDTAEMRVAFLRHSQAFCSLSLRDFKKVGVTIVGPPKKIVSSLKALETHAKNGPVPV